MKAGILTSAYFFQFFSLINTTTSSIPILYNQNMSQPINLAIVGTGIFATDNHLPTIQKIPGLKPYAAYNRTKSKAETFAQKPTLLWIKFMIHWKKF